MFVQVAYVGRNDKALSSSQLHALHELIAMMLSAPILVNGTASAFCVLAVKPSQAAVAPTAMPVRETNPWAHAPAAPAANTGAAATFSGKIGYRSSELF